ncbi:MAG: ADP-ribosylation factor-like protein [Candidatus Hodarchaeota archaeon]
MKLLLFGPPAAGKTSLLHTTMENTSFMAVENLAPTKGISRETYRFRGLMEITVWDAGGQKIYQDRYYGSQEENVFGSVDVPIYMVDATTIGEFMRDEFDKFVDAVLRNSPSTRMIYVLINKVDLENSKEERVFEILTKDLPENVHKKCTFTPVSVKDGSASARFIEIVDRAIEERAESMGKASRLRSVIEDFKKHSGADFILFNKNDGLIMTSTFGKFNTERLEFMAFQLSSLDSNIYEIYSNVLQLRGKPVTPLDLNTVVFESRDSYVIAKEVEEKGTLMVITKDKEVQNLVKVIEVISDTSPQYEELINVLMT